ncbi:hypothetical protein Q4555_06645 [Octadecabacter sp. 1_MG-2023]|uniref:DUF6638 family protein n=1 Tax=unclassified Octadecabacter TaxID=196158 RepID=UPI001C08658A|nr:MULTISPECIES: DUF6638 family protein [unclassified Octadecabacter]MBU2994371.1 hypothetical protein [Octadecabacter sp. B2R22]MDO6734339.1 hypothetical protein [Octadecabacter sp. 1_MG-2023]
MKRLISRGLMFGNLIPVVSPILVERYNRALKRLTGKQTELTDFHIDISGYSPEIGDEFGDDLYLNHHGVNRQFILLTTDQKTAPLLNAKFSTSRGILRQFIEANEAQLFALTARDAVAGELVNSVFALDTPARLFDIGHVEIEADTTDGAVASAQKLGGMIDRFMGEEDAWCDDVLIGEMIGLAKDTGDITRNPLTLKTMTFDQDNFWTAHLGGFYLFRDVEEPAAITMGDKESLGKLPIEHLLQRNERSAIAQFLKVNDLAEPIIEARGIDSAAILRQKMDFIVADVAAGLGEDLSRATRRDLRRLGRQYHDKLPAAWRGLADLVRWAEDGGPWPKIDSEHPAYFYTLRAKDHKDADLVNMLLAELTEMDVRQLFICHKEAFYRAYMGWPDEKKAYVAEFLSNEYQVDKAGTRDALFGHEAAMEEAPAAPKRQTTIDRVGPWGAVKRR